MRRKTSKVIIESMVQCPFCDQKVKAKELAEHARSAHAGKTPYAPNQKGSETRTLDGVEVKDTDLIREIKQHLIDEGGMLVDPKLLQTVDQQNRRDARWRNTSLQNRAKSRPEDHASTNIFQKIGGLGKGRSSPLKVESGQETDDLQALLLAAIEEVDSTRYVVQMTCPFCQVGLNPKNVLKHLAKVHSNVELSAAELYEIRTRISGLDGNYPSQGAKNARLGWKQQQSIAVDNFRRSLKARKSKPAGQTPKAARERDIAETENLVKCPLCKHRTQYNVLFVHLQVGHPQVSPKKVMAKFNRVYRSKSPGERNRYMDELNEFVRDYERLRQGLDESRDGSKYIGHMRREQGRFGSFPLHDDYSDESNAE